MNKRNIKQLEESSGELANFVRNKRKKLHYTQLELSKRVGVGLRFLKELEQGKKTLRLDKVSQVLNYFGYDLLPSPKKKPISLEE